MTNFAIPVEERKKYLVAVAGGSGTRMGSDLPKQFLELSGVPILQRTIERFVEAEPDIRVVTVLPAASRPLWEELCAKHGLNVPQIIAKGGFTRFHSVKNALAKVPDGALVAVHDGVRPLVSVALIRRMFAEMSGARALVPVLPVTDTLKNADPQGPDPDRSRVVAVQTPQIFRSEDLKAAYGALGFSTSFTDDASVAKEYGIALTYTAGERYNIKITTPEDLSLARLLLTL